MTTLAAFQTLLHRYSGQDYIVVGTPVANRSRIEVESLIGFFVNSLVLRTDFTGDPTFRELLGRVRTTAVNAFAHEQLPFERLGSEQVLAEVWPGRQPALRGALPAVYRCRRRGGVRLARRRASPRLDHDGPSSTSRSTSGKTAEGLWGHLEYRTDLFRPETITRLAGHFVRILEAVTADPDARLSELDVLGDAERRRVVDEVESARGSPSRATFACTSCSRSVSAGYPRR